MAREIVQYASNVLPSGGSGEQLTPFKEAPPLMPINVADAETAAKVKLGGAIGDIGESWAKIEQYKKMHNEEITANYIFNTFHDDQLSEQQAWEKKYRGVDALSPEAVMERRRDLEERINDTVANSGLDPQNQQALRKMLSTVKSQMVAQSANWQSQQQYAVETANIETDYQTRLNAIANGADWQDQAAKHKAFIDMTQPGNKTLGLLHEARFEAAGIKLKDDIAYASVVNRFKLGTAESDIDGAIKFIRNPDNLKDISLEQRRGLENYVLAQQAHDIELDNKRRVINQNRDLDSISSFFFKGNIRAAVDAVQNSPYIHGDDKIRIVRSLQQPAPEGKSNSSTYLSGIDKMYDPSMPIEDKKTWLLSNRGNLTDGDFKHLAAVGMSQERMNDKVAIKSGIETIKAALITPGFSSQTQKERVDRAIKTYESGVEQYKDSLKTPDQIKAYANQILKMAEYSNVNPIQDMKDDMKKLRGVGISSVPVVPVSQQKTVTIDGRQYKDGDIIIRNGVKSVVRVK